LDRRNLNSITKIKNISYQQRKRRLGKAKKTVQKGQQIISIGPLIVEKLDRCSNIFFDAIINSLSGKPKASLRRKSPSHQRV
jgi:hypothetical protein